VKKPHLWLIRLVGVLVPRRLRADWRQEWEAELRRREALMAEWERLGGRARLDLWRRSLGAFRDALWLQPKRWEDEMIQDIRYGVRMLLKSKSFTAVALLSLALGIGVNTAIFSVINTVLFKPLPVKAPGELTYLFNAEPGSFIGYTQLSFPDLEDLRRESKSFTDILGYFPSPLALDHDGQSEIVQASFVTGNYFKTLGVAPLRGRAFGSEEESPASPSLVAVLSHEAWQRRFGADPEIVGKTILANGNRLTVIGVAPSGFRGLFRGIPEEIWAPLNAYPALRPNDRAMLTDRQTRQMFSLGRLKPGVTLAQAQSEVGPLARRLEEAYPKTNKGRKVSLLPASQIKILPGVDKILYGGSAVLIAVAGIVLLIACANVASLMLARVAARRKELAVRAALGASRVRLIRQLLTESLLLAVAGGGLSVLMASATNSALNSFRPTIFNTKPSFGFSLDFRVLGFAMIVTLLTAVLAGLVPALKASRRNPALTLNEESGTVSEGRSKRRMLNGLVVAQVALSLALVVCAGLTAQSLRNVYRIDPGFDRDQIVTASFLPSLRGYDDARIKTFKRALMERVRALPGISSAGIASIVPLTLDDYTLHCAPQESASTPAEEWPETQLDFIDPGYLATLHIPILRGRNFTEHEYQTAAPVAVVNQTLANRFWPGQDPVGRRIRFAQDKNDYEVVGVARDGKYVTLGEAPQPLVYRILPEGADGDVNLLARVTGDKSAALGAIRDLARQLDETMPVIQLGTLEQRFGPALLIPQSAAVLFGLFGLLGLILALAGLYGVIAFSVSQRSHEIGIRMALGAGRRDILRLVIRQGLALTLTGGAIGLTLAFALTRTLATILYGVSVTDALTFMAATLLFTVVALLACYLPARKATRVDPLVALRHQ
jgi:predicted permease